MSRLNAIEALSGQHWQDDVTTQTEFVEFVLKRRGQSNVSRWQSECRIHKRIEGETHERAT
jgi:hypothetical protein